MGIFDRFNTKNKAAEQEKIIAEKKEREHQNVVEEQRAAHENLMWPGIQRLNKLAVNGSTISADDPVTEARKDEIGPLVYEPDLTPEMLQDLNLQELLFVQLTMTVFNKSAALLNYEKNSRVLHNELLGRIHKAEKFYIIFNRKTGYPLIDGGYVLVYLDREHADRAAELYKAQFRDAGVVERPGENAPADENGRRPLALFDYLYYLGTENVLIDNGWYKGSIKRSEVSAPIDWNSDPKKTPPTNPKLVFAMIDYISEVRWPVKYDKRDENVKKKSERMMKRIPTARYIIPAKVTGVNSDNVPEELPEGKKISRQVQLPAIEVNKKRYLPLFTDMLEYSKKFSDSEMKPTIFEYKELVRFVTGGIEGVIINPNGQGIIVPKDKVQSLLFEAAGSKKTDSAGKDSTGSKT